MKSRSFLLLILFAVASLFCSGCIVTAKPGTGCYVPHGCAAPQPMRMPCFPPTNCPPVQIITPPGTQTTTTPPEVTFRSTSHSPVSSDAETAMPLIVDPTERNALIYRRIAELICATAQFQLETGENAEDSLEQFAHWPRIDEHSEEHLKAPLCLVTQEPELLIVKEDHNTGHGETFLQLALVRDPAHTDVRDRWTDVANRAGAIMRQMLDLAREDGDANYWQVTGYTVHQGSMLNDLVEYQFKDGDDAEVEVEIFPFVLQWVG